MTSRRRWVPASGAKVRPPRLPPATAVAISMPKESRRWEGMETRMPCSPRLALRLLSMRAHCEWSVVERDVSETSLWPLSASPSMVAETIWSSGRSRTGR